MLWLLGDLHSLQIMTYVQKWVIDMYYCHYTKTGQTTCVQTNLIKTNFRGTTKMQFFLSEYSNTCTVLQQTKQDYRKLVCVNQKFVFRVFFLMRLYRTYIFQRSYIHELYVCTYIGTKSKKLHTSKYKLLFSCGFIAYDINVVYYRKMPNSRIIEKN